MHAPAMRVSFHVRVFNPALPATPVLTTDSVPVSSAVPSIALSPAPTSAAEAPEKDRWPSRR